VLTNGQTHSRRSRPAWGEEDRPAAAFAQLVDPARAPLTARVAVNRCETPFRHRHRQDARQLRQDGTPPTIPSYSTGWHANSSGTLELQAMHRLMMTTPPTSKTRRDGGPLRLDPANALYSRVPLVRLDAEAL